MGQRRRFDGPGVRHHVMNRGLGKRLMFAGRQDRRYFLSQLARAFRRAQLEIEAFSLLGTHFHLLVRTQDGTLSEGMRRVQNGYSRWFNRRNRRDGPLARGRFRSRPVDSNAYLLAVVPYIDFNPVKAGLAPSPSLHEAGSARHYLSNRFPPWMSPTRIAELLARRSCEGEAPEKTYSRILGTPPTPHEIELVENRFRAAPSTVDDLDYVLAAPGERALRWMEEKARNADGLRPACALIPPSALEVSARAVRREVGGMTIRRSRKDCDPWPLLLFGLQNGVSGLSGAALSARHGVSMSTAGRYVQVHRGLIEENDAYRHACRQVLERALRLTYRRSRIA
jgi:REP element-mobilizing transposase RayT